MDFNKPVNRLGTYCTQWDFVKDRFGKEGLLPFTISDMDMPTSPEIQKALEKRISHGIFGYTRWDHSDYKNAIIHWYQSRFATKIESDWIAYAPNVIYAVVQFLQMHNPQGEAVAVITPCYDGFEKILKANHFAMNTIHMSTNELDWDLFEQQISKSRIFLLCNPNNPNGKLWSEEELSKMLEICKKHKVYIISDDIHMDYVYAPKKFTPITRIAEKFDYLDKVLIITSSSKTFNLSSLGGAYIICPNQEDKAKYLNILQNRDSLASAMCLHIESVIAGYNHSGQWLDELCAYYHENLLFVQKTLSESHLGLKMEIPEATYFGWIDCSDLNLSSEEIKDRLINKGKVAIMDGDRYLEQRPFLRMVIACPRSKVEDGLQRLIQSFE
ncbi:MAG: MalY/PatB family protein [Brevinema sp.]